MDNIQNSLLTMGAPKTTTVRNKAGAKNTASKDESSFHKLLEEQQQPAAQSQETTVGQKPQQGTQDQGQSEEGGLPTQKELENQMLLAAMVVVTAPTVTQTEPVAEQAPEQLLAAVPVVEGEKLAEPMQLNQPVLEQTQPETADQTVQTGLEEVQTADVQQNQAKPVQEQSVQPSEVKEAEQPVQEAPKAKADVVEAGQMLEQPVFREVKAVPIQVGETPAAEHQNPAPHLQMERPVADAIRSGASRVEVELEPHTLGKVRVELTLDRDGAMHILLRAEKASTQALLDRGSLELQSLLGREAHQEVQVETERFHEDQVPVYYDQPQEQDERQNSRENRQQHQRQQQESGEDFLHQLRLGLTPMYSV